jgi:predicted anti-sigma-YlaC factor YlaD
MLKCIEATRLVSESQERELRLGERLPLRLHLMMCRGCRNAELQLAVLRRAMRTFARPAESSEPSNPRDGP